MKTLLSLLLFPALTCVTMAQNTPVLDAASNPTSDTSSAVGLLVRDGKAFLLHGGQLEAIKQPMSLTISPDGLITGFDGKSVSLPEGRMLTMDGALTPIPNPVSAAIVPGLPTQSVASPMDRAEAEASEANSKTIPSTLDAGTMDDGAGSPIKDTSTSGGSANHSRQGSNGSTESMPAGSP